MGLSAQEIDRELLRRTEAELIARGVITASTVVGLVSPDKGHTHSIVRVGNEWIDTQDKPEMYLPLKMERILLSKKRFNVLLGGRGSAKSVSAIDVALIDAKDSGAKTYFLREYQSSIKQSVHSLIKDEIARLEFPGFNVKDTSIEIDSEEVFAFSGIARNTASIKSSHGFRRFMVEEAQFMTKESLDALTPTLRNKPNKGLPRKFSPQEEEIIDDPNVSLLFAANPASSEDPFSQRFIVPFLEALERDGYYEDELHCVVMMNYDDNPWFDESGLETELKWDKEHRKPAEFQHIWLGDFNDSIENAIVQAEWFDACVDAHLSLGY